MYRIYVILFILAGVLKVHAQSVTVASFDLAETDATANMPGTTVLDKEGEKCALIKIQTTKNGFSFDVGRLGVQGTKQKTGEIWVYVPAGVKKITLTHPVYDPCEWQFKEALQKARTYIMKLAISENFHTQQLNIMYSPIQTIVLLDGQLVDASNGKISMNVLHGEHEYVAVASGYAPSSGSITLNSKYPYNLNINLKRNAKELAVIEKYKPKRILEEKDEEEADAVQLQPKTFRVDSVSFTMMPVEGGTFMMGATTEQMDTEEDEVPLHQVNLNGFYIGETEVTQQLWQAVMGANTSHFLGDQKPVENVTWNMCQTFITRLNEMTGEQFRLPTEAEWEFAARGGNKTNNTQYSGSAVLHEVGWDADNCESTTHDVKMKKANELGIYDMSGNVSEWCQDWKGAYTSTPQTAPTGPQSGTRRVVRGGSWNSYTSSECRTAARGSNIPNARTFNMGFRLARDL